MSVKIMSQVFERYPNGGGEMLLALALADHADDDGTRIFPSVNRLSKKTRQSDRTVQRQLKKMQEIGWLILVADENGGRGKAREYRINDDWLKGDNLSFSEKGDKSKRVTSATQKGDIHDIKGDICDIKGDIHDIKGDTAMSPESSITIIEPSYNHQVEPSYARARKPEKSKQPKKPELLPVQNLVDQETWNDFLDIRKKLKAINSPRAITSLINKIEKLKAQGHDPTEVVNQSIRSSWKDIYPLKNNGLRLVEPQDRQDYNRQQTEIAKRRLFGDMVLQREEKDITP